MMRKVTRKMRFVAVILSLAMIFQNTFSVLATADVEVNTAAEVSEEESAAAKETPAAETPEVKEAPSEETVSSETVQNADVLVADDSQKTEEVSDGSGTEESLADETEQSENNDENESKKDESEEIISEDSNKEKSEEQDEIVDELTPTPTPDVTEAPVEYETRFTCTSSDGNATVVAVTTETAQIPENAKLHADYMAPGSAAYESAIASIEAALGISDDETRELYGVLYDIYFLYEGNRIEPNDQVQVSISFANAVAQDIPDDMEAEKSVVMHVTDSGSVSNVTDSVSTDADGAISSAGFTSSSFSPFAVMTQVKAAPRRVAPSVSFDISSLLTDVFVEDTDMNSDGQYVIRRGNSYPIHIYFEEVEGNQFPNNETAMAFAFPEDISVIDIPATNFETSVQNGVYTVYGNTYWVEDNVLYVLWNTGDPAFDKLTAAQNAKMDFIINANFISTENEFRFSFGGKTLSFIYDDSHNVSVNKDGNYNKETDEVDYTITVVSDGLSENVRVMDSFVGNSFSIIPGSVRVLSGLWPETAYTGNYNINSTENDLDVTIDSVRDKEAIYIRYSATIDYSKAVNGKIEGDNAKNTVRISAEDDGDDSDNTSINEVYGISVGAPSKKLTGQVSGEEKEILTWTIISNPDHKADMGGASITDTIDQKSQDIMKYSGDNIKIKVTKENGDVVNRIVKWENLTKHSDSSWTYTAPEGDGKAKYEITYTTEVDKTSLLEPVKVNNKVDDGNGTDNGSAEVGREDSFVYTVTKKATAVSMEEVEWTIAVSVPKEGYQTLVITDTYPYLQDWVSSLFCNDTLKSVSVSGLDANESYSEDISDPSKLVLTFYKDKNKQTTGLNSSSSTRQLVIKVVTKNNTEWLETAAARPEDTWLREHTNNVKATANNIDKNSSDTAVIQETEFSKTGSHAGYITLDGVKYPYFRYTLTLKGVSSKTFDITDHFDTRLTYYNPSSSDFEFGYIPYDLHDANMILYGGSADWDINESSMRASVENVDAGSAVIHVSDLPVTKGGTYYGKYQIVYYLIAKDAASLKLLANESAENGGTATLANTAAWDGTEATTYVDYSYETVDKELVKKAGGGSDRIAQYKISINEAGAMLNGGKPLNLTDTFTSQSIDYSSIVVTPSEGVTYDSSSNSLIFVIPDSTPTVITYNATVLGTSNVEYSNTVELNGQRKETSAKQSFSTSGSSSASNPYIRILKYKDSDMKIGLKGAEFELFRISTNDYVRDTKGASAGQKVIFVTGDDGYVTVEGDDEKRGWVLHEGEEYYLKEIKAPDGYRLDNIEYHFTIAKDVKDVTDYSDYVYFNGDILKIRNYQKQGKLNITKTVKGTNRKDFKVSVKNSDGKWMNLDGTTSDTVVWLDLTEGQTLQVSKLPIGIYTITENVDDAEIQNYTLDTVSYSVNNGVAQKTEDASITVEVTDSTVGESIAITNTYTQDKGKLKVTKTTTGATTPDNTVFTVKNAVTGEVVSKKYSEFKSAGYFEVEVPVGTYTVTETGAEIAAYNLTVTGGKSAVLVSKGATQNVAIKNQYTEKKGSLKISKTSTGATTPSDATFTVRNQSTGSTVATKKYADFVNGSVTISDLPLGTYIVTETGAEVTNYILNVSGNATATISTEGQTASVSLINTYTKYKGGLKVTKVTNGSTTPDSAVFTVKDSNGKTIATKIYADFKATGSFTLTNLDPGVYTVEEFGAEKLGYELAVSANNTAVLTKDQVVEIEVINTYSEKKGDLKITKEVKSKKIDTSKSFKFTVVLSASVNGTYSVAKKSGSSTNVGSVSFTNGVSAPISLKHGEEATIVGLPADISYTVSEESVENYSASATGDTGTIQKGISKTAAFVNTDTSKGDLQITKVISGNAIKYSDVFEVKVTLTNASEINGIYGDAEFTNGVAFINLKGGETRTIKGLPNGVTYEIVETDTKGYIVSYLDSNKKDTSKGTIAGGKVGDSAAQTLITNTKDIYGGLTVSKELKGLNAGASKEFQFTVTLGDSSISGTYGDMEFNNGIASFTLKGGETKTADGLPNGIGYQVEEQSYLDEGYTTSVPDNAIGEIVGTSDGTVSKDNQVVITNTLHSEGDLIVKKIVAGNSGDRTHSFAFKATLKGEVVDGTYGEMTFKDKEAVFWLKAGESITASGLPHDIAFEVEEMDPYGHAVSYEVNGTVGNKGVISNDNVNIVTVTNTKNEYGGIKIVKKTAGSDPDKKTWFAFNVTLSDKSISGTYGNVTFVNGVSTMPQGTTDVDYVNGKVPSGYFKVTKAAPAVITGLPAGVSYSILEDSYAKTYDKQEGTNTSGTIIGVASTPGAVKEELIDAENISTFTNTRDRTGKLVIQKVLTGTAQDPNEEFSFDIQMIKSDKTPLNGEFDDVLFVNGKAEVKLKGGEKKIITGLPLNARFTVNENSVPGYNVSYDLSYRETIKENGVNLRDSDGNNIKQEIVEEGIHSGTIEIDQRIVTVTNNRNKTKVTIRKTDIAGTLIADAYLIVTDKSGETVGSWMSSAAKAYELELAPGTYTLTEITAPDGFEVAKNLAFTVESNGKITVNGKETADVTLVDEYSDHTVKISKTDVGGNEIPDAVLKVYDKDGNQVGEDIKTDGKTPHEIELQPGTYKLVEITAPDGYEKAEDITFTVDKDGKVTVDDEDVKGTVTMVDEYSDQTVKISKTDVGGNEIPDAVLRIYDEDGNQVGEDIKTDGKTPHEIELQPGTYKLVEITAPDGYEKAEDITFTVDKDGKVTVDDEDVKGTVTMVDEYSDQTVKISKTDVGGNEIPDAVLKVYDKDGNQVGEDIKTDGKTPHEIELQPGTYKLVEITAPDGYEKAEDITFTVDKDGKVTVDDEDVKGTVTMVDEYSDQTVKISKTDVGGNEIPDAVLRIYDEDGNQVGEDIKTDGKTPHEIELQPGTYKLVEITAPDGYEKAEDITFTVDKDGKVTVDDEDVKGTVTMVDEYSDQTVKISKTDVGGNEIPDAFLKVYDKDGNQVGEDIKTDGKTPHEIELQPGTYKLVEITAPDGYEKAEDITFTVDKDGKVTVDDEDVEGTVTMVDEYSTGKGSISVTKRIALIDEDFDLVDLYTTSATYYVRLFSDSEGLHPYGAAKALQITNGSSGTATWSDLPDGKYYIFETTADGSIVPWDETITDTERGGVEYYCTLEDGSPKTVEIDTKADEVDGAVNLVNAYFEIPGGFAYRGVIMIQKKVLNGTEVYDTDDVFYAGVFSSPDQETADTVNGNLLVVKLENNGNAVRLEVPVYEDGSSKTYYVFETDENGKKINKADFKYTVSGEDSVNLSIDKGFTGDVTITNTLIIATATPTPAPTQTPTATPAATEAPKTGDSSNISWYFALLVSALFAAFGAGAYKKKRVRK